MQRYFLLLIILFFISGCKIFEPSYFTSPAISEISTKKTKEVDKIKWKNEEESKNLLYRGFIVSKEYDPHTNLWKYHFESLNKENFFEFFYDKKLGYDNDLVEITLKKEFNKNILDKIILLKENYDKKSYIETFTAKSSLNSKKKLKKRTINRINRSLGVPSEVKIDIK